MLVWWCSGVCVNGSLCECENGWSGYGDLISHPFTDCSQHIVTILTLYCGVVVEGFASMIYALYKLVTIGRDEIRYYSDLNINDYPAPNAVVRIPSPQSAKTPLLMPKYLILLALAIIPLHIIIVIFSVFDGMCCFWSTASHHQSYNGTFMGCQHLYKYRSWFDRLRFSRIYEVRSCCICSLFI